MIILVILLLLHRTGTVLSQHEGESCNFPNGSPGICTKPDACPPVYERLLSGNEPEKICMYYRLEVFICCPINTPATTTTTLPPVTENPVGDGRGAIARTRCAEYAKAVWAIKDGPLLAGHRQKVNVSQCAIKTQKLIVGGKKAERMEFPHMVAVGYHLPNGNIGWYCGGTLISDLYVLTAAHCASSEEWGRATWARLGVLNLKRSDIGIRPVNRRIVARITHPNYRAPSKYHDIALFRLSRRVTFNAWIRPACLHTAPTTGTEKAIATGWGHLNWGDEVGPDDLYKVTLPIISAQNCNKSYATVELSKGVIGEWQTCAGSPGRDTCQGDSGGPLVIFSDPKKYYCMYDVVGVTSLGQLCGETIPGIYTRVYNYVSWIESIVWRKRRYRARHWSRD